MQQGKVIPLDCELAIDAASYGIAHKLPLADSIIKGFEKNGHAVTVDEPCLSGI